jgi:hypothetical protein
MDWTIGDNSMMATTHALWGLAVAIAALPAVPDGVAVPSVLAAAFVGGLAPDADVVATHRKTLHFPVLLPALSVVLLAVSLATASPPLWLATVGIGSAALHSASDVLGGSVEARPWTYSSDEAVYNHLLGRWHRPMRLVRYSGAPEDFLLGAACGLFAIQSTATTPAVDRALLALVVATGGFALVRKRLHRLPALADALVPATLRHRLPAVRVEEGEEGTTLSVGFER